MYNILHDGPTHLPTGPRNYQASSKTKQRASMAALQWAADSAGLSYGKFTQSLTPEDEVRIQLDYDEWRRQKQHEVAARRLERKPEEPLTEGFIITDDDA